MNVAERNSLYLKGIVEADGLFPHLENPPACGFFDWDFGLNELPQAPGVIVSRGPRQFGKSTWLEQQLRETVRNFGPGSALFLNGDYIAGPRSHRQRSPKNPAWRITPSRMAISIYSPIF